MSDNLVYEITQRMTNSGVVRQDMNEAAKLVMGMFQDRYLKQLDTALDSHRRRVEKEPPKEVQLIRAMKAFMPEEKHGMLDRTIDMMLLKGTYDSIRSELNGEMGFRPESVARESVARESVHADGVYDMDAACVERRSAGQNKKPEQLNGFRPEMLFMMMAMMGIMPGTERPW